MGELAGTDIRFCWNIGAENRSPFPISFLNSEQVPKDILGFIISNPG